jgi:hypothetical protein
VWRLTLDPPPAAPQPAAAALVVIDADTGRPIPGFE